MTTLKFWESVKQAMPDQGRVYQSDRTSIDDVCAVLERGRSHAALKDFGDWSDGSVVKDMDRSCQGCKLDSQHYVRQCTIACNSSSKGIQHLWPL